ncbi:MAG: hypothetical protein HYS80_01405 [Candidatus Aenigmarchaeota archaeon]|nr:hypothetical protein [Candidatus Aenigmarchaeota archaeon]
MKAALLSLVVLFVTVSATTGIIYLSSQLKNTTDKVPPTNQISKSVPSKTATILPAYENSQSWVVISTSNSVKLEEDKLRVLVSVDSGKNPKNGGRVVIRFNPRYLQVLDSLPSQEGVQVRLSRKLFAYDQILSTEADNKNGVVDINLKKKDESYVTESYFATIDFKPIVAGETNIFADRNSTQIYYNQVNIQPQMIFKDATVKIN